jgi:hypothetical protein
MPDWHFYNSEKAFRHATHDRAVTKRPLDVFKLKELREYAQDVELKVLLCIRDPKAMLTSFHKSVPDDYFYHADKQYFVPRNGPPVLTNPGLIQVHKALMKMHNSELDTEIIRYEDTLKRPYTPGKTPKSMSRALNGDRPMDTSRLEAWKDHMPRLKDQFSRFPELYDIMDEYGYEYEGLI